MYKKTADLHHLHERTGSHATKGSGRGTVWWTVAEIESSDFPVEVKEAMKAAQSIFMRLVNRRDEAVKARDTETIRACHLAMRVLNKNAKAMRKKWKGG